MMKLLFIVILTILIFGCNSSENSQIGTGKNDPTLFYEVVVDTSVIACFSSSGHSHQVTNSTVCQLNSSDLHTIEYLLINCVNEYNLNKAKELREEDTFYSRRQLRKGYYIINLKNYKRQYQVSISADGEKYVWIKCFCDTFGFDWKREQVLIKDGGNCYFQTGINITKKEHFYLYVNGIG